ncbi:hypothetical protein DFJ74DRAFT_685025 [Hyaloraphidium curvatum]|nr:hypothetical protein DFJ74DRAFT_685025 [Hyaloraphidium curvatum]
MFRRVEHILFAAWSAALIAAAVLQAEASPIAADEHPSRTEHLGAVFQRSCGDCGVDQYCEFSYPGAPEDHVACVEYGGARDHGLYRRYEEVTDTKQPVVMLYTSGTSLTKGAQVTIPGQLSSSGQAITQTFTISATGSVVVESIEIDPTDCTPLSMSLTGTPSYPTTVPDGGSFTFQVVAQVTELDYPIEDTPAATMTVVAPSGVRDPPYTVTVSAAFTPLPT